MLATDFKKGISLFETRNFKISFLEKHCDKFYTNFTLNIGINYFQRSVIRRNNFTGWFKRSISDQKVFLWYKFVLNVNQIQLNSV